MNEYRTPDKEIYLAENGGWHFNKRACDYAVMMLDGDRRQSLGGEEEIEGRNDSHRA